MANLQNQTQNKGQQGNLQGKDWSKSGSDMTPKHAGEYEKSAQGKGFDKNKQGSRVSDDEIDMDSEESVGRKGRE